MSSENLLFSVLLGSAPCDPDRSGRGRFGRSFFGRIHAGTYRKSSSNSRLASVGSARWSWRILSESIRLLLRLLKALATRPLARAGAGGLNFLPRPTTVSWTFELKGEVVLALRALKALGLRLAMKSPPPESGETALADAPNVVVLYGGKSFARSNSQSQSDSSCLQPAIRASSNPAGVLLRANSRMDAGVA